MKLSTALPCLERLVLNAAKKSCEDGFSKYIGCSLVHIQSMWKKWEIICWGSWRKGTYYHSLPWVCVDVIVECVLFISYCFLMFKCLSNVLQWIISKYYRILFLTCHSDVLLAAVTGLHTKFDNSNGLLWPCNDCLIWYYGRIWAFWQQSPFKFTIC